MENKQGKQPQANKKGYKGKRKQRTINRNIPLADITPTGYMALVGFKATLRG